MMKITIQTWVVIFCCGVFIASADEKALQINWDNLIPAHLKSEDLLKDLDEDQLDMVHWVINTLESLPKRGPETKEYYQEIDKAMPALKKAGIDIVAVMEKRKRIRTAMAEELNGKYVRIPGYLLPLEISRNAVTEFLLVPYLGACIHVPPPPPNQIVLVKTASKKGYKNKQLYDPVWVTGVLSIQSMVKDLYLVDGSAEINIGYAMKADQIEPYE